MPLKPLTTFIVLCVALVVNSFGGVNQSSISGWRISFEPAPAIWSNSKAEKPLTITLTNGTDRMLWVFESNPLNDYEVSITDLKGNPISMTSEGLRIQERERSTLFRTMREKVPPGGSRKTYVDLAECYQLPPGKYVVHARLRSNTQDIMDAKTDRRKPQVNEPSGSATIQITP